MTRGRPHGPLVVLLWSLAAFAVMAVAAGQSLSGVERSVFEGIFDLPDWLEQPFVALSYLGTIGLFVLVIVTCWRVRRITPALMAVAGAALAYLLTYGTKEWIVARARPASLTDIEPRTELDPVAVDGFPSGHVAVATTLALLLTPLLPGRARPWVWLAPVVVALSRVYLGEHMPLDVLGGVAIGLMAGSAVQLAIPPQREAANDAREAGAVAGREA